MWWCILASKKIFLKFFERSKHLCFKTIHAEIPTALAVGLNANEVCEFCP